MKQIISKSGWLVMAAALTMGMSLSTGLTSCSSDDDVVQTPPAKGVSTVHVSVNAGVDNGTRSIVETTTVGSTTSRTLKFTEGDQLYVYRSIGMVNPPMYLAGMLDVESLSDDKTSATFSGDLVVYEDKATYNSETGQWESHLVPSSYDFGDSDPLTGSTGTLFFEGVSGNMYIDRDTKQLCVSEEKIGSSVDDLMTSLLEVKGDYDGDVKGFPLAPAPNCIVSCTIPHAATPEEGFFTVSYWSGPSADQLTMKTSRNLRRYKDSPFTFAFFGDTYSTYHQIRIEDDYYGTFTVDLGKKILSNGKVYNVTRGLKITSNTSAAVPAPFDGNTYLFTDECDINISGVGFEKKVNLQGADNTINLNGVAAFCGTGDFITGYGSNSPSINLHITGDNTIVCKGDYANAVHTNTLKLSGNGTLTVTSKYADACGLLANNYNSENNDYSTTTECNVSAQLAYDATECRVTRSARTDNGDGTYTWTYTVRTFFAVSADKAFTVNYGVYQFDEGNVTAKVSGPTYSERLVFNACPVDLTITNLEVSQTYPYGNFIESLGNADSQPSIVITINGQNNVVLNSQPLSGNNTPANFIKCVDDLAFKGNGTLTITTADADHYGINGSYSAAAGYTVNRTGGSNGDGTYTWTYTVSPSE